MKTITVETNISKAASYDLYLQPKSETESVIAACGPHCLVVDTIESRGVLYSERVPVAAVAAPGSGMRIESIQGLWTRKGKTCDTNEKRLRSVNVSSILCDVGKQSFAIRLNAKMLADVAAACGAKDGCITLLVNPDDDTVPMLIMPHQNNTAVGFLAGLSRMAGKRLSDFAALASEYVPYFREKK